MRSGEAERLIGRDERAIESASWSDGVSTVLSLRRLRDRFAVVCTGIFFRLLAFCLLEAWPFHVTGRLSSHQPRTGRVGPLADTQADGHSGSTTHVSSLWHSPVIVPLPVAPSHRPAAPHLAWRRMGLFYFLPRGP
ncbi:unnamed protein product [Protopolystoma xenopodis]|uniref:Uncharacterized protein n=1 Tax=Protopolystoma xenopodis TaxID=117903 RepID=A0A448WGP3_9PLAT|nr:unnamed protein product [Protopolystoma xenopodis]